MIQSPVTLLSSLLSRRKPRSFSGRHVLITGGSEGIGLEIAKQCAARGATVTLVARTRSKLDAARAAVLAATPGAKVGVQTADVGQSAQVAQAVELGEKELGPVDVCIASAGIAIPKYFEELTQDDWAKMMSVNYFGVVHLAQAVLPGMVSRGEGQFAAVSSMAAAVPFVGYAGYAPTKAACRSLMDVLRNEYCDTPLQFHVAFPPDTDTPGYEKAGHPHPPSPSTHPHPGPGPGPVSVPGHAWMALAPTISPTIIAPPRRRTRPSRGRRATCSPTRSTRPSR